MLYDTQIVSTITFYDIMQIITQCIRAKKPRRILLKDFSIVMLKVRDVKTIIIHFWFYTLLYFECLMHIVKPKSQRTVLGLT